MDADTEFEYAIGGSFEKEKGQLYTFPRFSKYKGMSFGDEADILYGGDEEVRHQEARDWMEEMEEKYGDDSGVKFETLSLDEWLSEYRCDISEKDHEDGYMLAHGQIFAKGGELMNADTQVDYAKGGKVKDFEKGKWLQGKKWHIYKGYSGWELEIYKGDNLIEQYSIDIEPSDDILDDDDKKVDIITYSPSMSGEILIPENIQLKVITLFEKAYPKNNFGDEYEHQINKNQYSKMYAKGGKTDDNWIQDVTEEMEKDGTEGAFTKQAKRHKMTPIQFAKKVLKNPKKFSLKTRRRAQFVKNVNPEKFYEGGNISQVSKVGDPDYPTYEL